MRQRSIIEKTTSKEVTEELKKEECQGHAQRVDKVEDKQRTAKLFTKMTVSSSTIGF